MAKLKRKAREKGYGRHSPAGYAYLQKEKRKTTPVYFKHIKRTSDAERLRKAGLSEKELRTLGYR